MGQPTVKLIHRTWDEYVNQVNADVQTAAIALERWLEGDATVKPPDVADAAEVRRIVQMQYRSGADEQDCYYAEADLANRRHSTATPAALTVGQLIDTLQGLDPTLPIVLVVGGVEGHIDAVEVPPSA